MAVTCLVTIHGIGFQEAPREGVPGYADGLHAHLATQLPDLLSSDPDRRDYQQGDSVPIYVSSRWPVSGGTLSAGLARLGTWKAAPADEEIDSTGAPLVEGSRSVAHVALVYSQLEDLGPQPMATLEAATRALVEHQHYESIGGVVRTILGDGLAALEHRAPPPGATSPGSLQRRTDIPPLHRHLFHIGGDAAQQPGGLVGTIRQLEDDVCAYVCRNDLRERVRGFIWEALRRLAAREDVGTIVLNTHSNGTVMGFDFLRDASDAVASRVGLFVTAGSPLRKYVDLFSWGAQVNDVAAAGPWLNFLDRKDPVADPLAHPPAWQTPSGSASAPAPSDLFVYQADDAADTEPFKIEDIVVDNLADSSGGGLQAHNYWDNEAGFVVPLAASLRRLVRAG
jgi:hypothetical protein